MPTNTNTSNPLLFLGDIILFSLSLYVTLLVRYGEIPDAALLETHFTAFSALFIVWALVFFVAGLYDRKTLLLPDSLWQLILKTQTFNSLIAVLFFYTIPFFSIAPKTNLFIYLVVSFIFLTVWRYWAARILAKQSQPRALLIASGPTARELKTELLDGGYGIELAAHLDPGAYSAKKLYLTAQQAINNHNISYIILDRYHPVVQEALPQLHSFLYTDLRFLSIDELYEAVFDRVPVNRLQHEWFIDHLHRTPHAAYDVLKRGMDIMLALILGILSLPFYLAVYPLIVFTGDGTLFSKQERVGKNNKIFTIYKFRTMLYSNKTVEEGNRVTKVGRFLRKTRIDELPQIFNVLKGDLSFIGPRPETPDLVEEYEKQIPFHNVRQLIKPGMSGWAQLWHEDPPKFEAEADKAQKKLAYDLYYVKNRSLFLDIKIALWTLRVLASRSGK